MAIIEAIKQGINTVITWIKMTYDAYAEWFYISGATVLFLAIKFVYKKIKDIF